MAPPRARLSPNHCSSVDVHFPAARVRGHAECAADAHRRDVRTARLDSIEADQELVALAVPSTDATAAREVAPVSAHRHRQSARTRRFAASPRASGRKLRGGARVLALARRRCTGIRGADRGWLVRRGDTKWANLHVHASDILPVPSARLHSDDGHPRSAVGVRTASAPSRDEQRRDCRMGRRSGPCEAPCLFCNSRVRRDGARDLHLIEP